jgi:hypothetical protein
LSKPVALAAAAGASYALIAGLISAAACNICLAALSGIARRLFAYIVCTRSCPTPFKAGVCVIITADLIIIAVAA